MTLPACLIIRASAGTGKTYQLSSRYVALLLRGMSPSSILATTFTRKAAGEILARIVRLLLNAMEDPDRRQALAHFAGLSDLDEQHCRDVLQRLSMDLHTLRVGTLDSYFGDIARRCAMWLDLESPWSIATDSSMELLRSEAIQQLLELSDQEVSLQIAHWLTKGESARSVHDLMLRTVVELEDTYHESKHRGIQAWQLADIPRLLDSAALNEALTAVEALPLPKGQLAKARAADLSRFCQQDWPEFLSKGLAAAIASRGGTFARQPLSQDTIDAYGPLIGHAVGFLAKQVADQTLGAWHLISQYDAIAVALKHRRRLYAHNDIPRQFVEPGNGVGAVRRGMTYSGIHDSRIEHILLDEFQDTSVAQWSALRPLADRTGKSVEGGTFFAVGDIKQSIYGWRGSVPSLLENLHRELPEAVEQTLAESHRSSPVVIEAVNAIFAGIPDYPDLGDHADDIRAWCAKFPPHSTSRQDLAGHVTLRTTARKSDHSEDDPGTVDSLQAVVELVMELAHDHPNATLGVLVTRNETVVELMHRLRLQGIAASEEGGRPLTDSAAVRTVLSAIQLADHPTDSLAGFHLAHGPLGKSSGLAKEEWKDGKVVRQRASFWRSQLFQEGFGKTVEKLAIECHSWCSAREWLRLQQLIELAFQFDESGWKRVSEFNAFVEKERVQAPSPSSIRVMTVHGAKGLEFDIVVVADLQERLVNPPGFAYRRDSDRSEVVQVCRYAKMPANRLVPPAIRETMAETRRRIVHERLCVLYVALTRAVHALHVIVAPANKSGKLPSSLGGLVLAALAPQGSTRNAMVWERGTPHWGTDPKRAKGTAEAPPAADVRSPDIQPIAFSPSGDGASRHSHWTSPSALEGEPYVAVGTLFQYRRTQGLELGTLAHRILETIDWLAPTGGALEQLQFQMDEFGWEASQRDAVAHLLTRWLASPQVRRLLSREGYEDYLPTDLVPACRAGRTLLQVRSEQRVAATLGKQHLSGAIDRLVIATADEVPVWCHIIDFKTDAVGAGGAKALAERVAYYLPQMAAYRSMMVSSLRLPAGRVRADLCFLQPGEVVTIDD